MFNFVTTLYVEISRILIAKTVTQCLYLAVHKGPIEPSQNINSIWSKYYSADNPKYIIRSEIVVQMQEKSFTKVRNLLN